MKVRARPLKDFSCLRASKCVTCLSRGNVRKKTHIAFIFTYAQASSLLIKFVCSFSGTLFYPPSPPSLSLSLSLPHFRSSTLCTPCPSEPSSTTQGHVSASPQSIPARAAASRGRRQRWEQSSVDEFEAARDNCMCDCQPFDAAAVQALASVLRRPLVKANFVKLSL